MENTNEQKQVKEIEMDIEEVESDFYKNSFGARHFTITLFHKGKELETPFHIGSRASYPEWQTVLGCLFADKNSYDCSRDFTDFCNEFGYSLDDDFEIEKAEEVYKQCKKISAELVEFLGEDFEQYENYINEKGF